MPTTTTDTTTTEAPPELPGTGDAVAHQLIAQVRRALPVNNHDALAALNALQARVAATPDRAFDVSKKCEHRIVGLPVGINARVRNTGEPHRQVRLEVWTPGGSHDVVVHADGTVATYVHDMSARAGR